MTQHEKPKKHVRYDYYKNGIDRSIGGDEANAIIEEIISIMAEHKVTVNTAEQILQDTISSITNETVIQKPHNTLT